MCCIFMGLYGVNLCYIPDWAHIHVCICVQRGHSAFNVHNHHHDPCQINRERLDRRQGADHMEKGSWKRVGRWVRLLLFIQSLRIGTVVENAAGSYKFQANCVRLVPWNVYILTQASREGSWWEKADRYLLLLSATHSARLVKQPSAKDWIHIDSYALDADQQDSTWSTEKYRQTINQQI